ncbi:helix-turn-helix domain-containing protein [Fictibacillus sp. FJAT-27399]|uniref:helix-turn-helix domain-containing protein n=1 Tax=Fictibacillus sp. FJAT-27399 TaxID=1729689 RepID=UPI00078335EE|nr:AraC family transcriptional regulator [Fictibacillus sp. FJAT-27399]
MRVLNLKLANSKLMMTHLPPFSSDPVKHDHGGDYQITIPISGIPCIEIEKQTRSMNKALRVITSPGEAHFHYTGESESKLLLINLQKEFVDQVASARLHVCHIDTAFRTYGENSSEKLVKIANDIIQTNLLNEVASGKLEELEWALADTLLSIQEGSHSEKWRKEITLNDHPLIKTVLSFIHEHYASELSLEELAKASRLSKNHFIRTFKEAAGCTPGQYVTKVRLERAIDLLRTTALDITTIGFAVGFGSLTAFERSFKKRYGCSVSHYRKSL